MSFQQGYTPFQEHHIHGNQMNQYPPQALHNVQGIPHNQVNQMAQMQHPSHQMLESQLPPQLPVAPKQRPVPWSERLLLEGKEVPTDTLMYEQITSRDAANIANSHSERQSMAYRSVGRLSRDLKFYDTIKNHRLRSIQRNVGGIWGDGYAGYGNGITNGKTQLVLPAHRKKPSRLPDYHVSRARTLHQADAPEELVPIRLEFDVERDKFKLRDTFLWNIHEQTVTLDQFVSGMMEDYRMANPLCGETILTAIREQLAEYHPAVHVPAQPSDMRVTIKLDITISNNQLLDQFEWDILNPDNDPEEFASVMCAEMSLPGEFETAIAHAIREQVQLFTRALFLVGYKFDGSYVAEDEIAHHLLPGITHEEVYRARAVVGGFSPSLIDITNNELERLDKDRERESRRKRRQGGRLGRRGVPALPDLSDVPRTFRTPVPSTVLPGALDLGPSVESFTEVIETYTVPNPKFEAKRVEVPAVPERNDSLPNVLFTTEPQEGSSDENAHGTISPSISRFPFLSRFRYSPLGRIFPKATPAPHDGVFSNLSAKPTVEDDSDNQLPAYADVEADPLPFYSPELDGEDLFIDGLPVGDLVSFFWNIMMVVIFQFPGFVLSYLLHTSHASKAGCNLGLGYTLISWAYAMCKVTEDGGTSETTPQKVILLEPNGIDTIGTLEGLDTYHSDLPGLETVTIERGKKILSLPAFVWLLFGAGLFITLRAVWELVQVKRMESKVMYGGCPAEDEEYV
ncbi:hypothetical protein BABINDRAFT_11959 [Babjeviella inositovora NRRL Y-12698]|uniref:SNF5-domain-containing protein n=1 Tax=Babjeviella inositovora NRRL Y-12698 TaxID=984486 RepID=A0A1E3QWI4_9ASCO|nr:uncharacterized protein BABINDRAFT_11959 [Babjeviella inositovora NRRL Y-12698]ODQ81884.1 hypothetical protein BABINDRAFT_11959 [Babjeviella inositovora NRRL Y-12698]